MSHPLDPHIADSVNQAISLATGESTVEGEHLSAITKLTALAANPRYAGNATALNAAIALLNASLSHLRDPIHH